MKSMNIKSRLARLTAMATAAAMLCVSAPAAAAVIAPEKEEVVYANLAADGSGGEYYVVNAFTLHGGGSVTDYGDYSAVRNMTTNDALAQNGDAVSFETSGDKLYYEGDLKTAELPWSIAVAYYLDGKECLAQELAGKNGSLEIKIKITKNEKCAGSWFDDYTLQVNATLDAEDCRNITAEGATIASVGGKKQLTYTCLPGKGLDAAIRADVSDFEMPALAINGVSMALDIDVDTSAITGEVGKLQSGAAKLNSAAGELQSGVAKVYAGADGLKSGTESLKSGTDALYKGMQALKSGITALNGGLAKLRTGAGEIKSGLLTLKNNSDGLRGGSAKISAALSSLKQAVSGFDALADKLKALAEGSAAIKTGIGALSEATASVKSGLAQIDVSALQSANDDAIRSLTAAEEQSGIDLGTAKAAFKKNNAAWDGVARVKAAVCGEGGLADSAAKLKSGYADIDAGIQGLYARLTDINGGIAAMKAGIEQLEAAYNDAAKGFDTAIGSYTAGVDKAAEGYVQLYAALYGSAGVSEGAGSLQTGVDAACEAGKKLCAGANTLYDGSAALRNGIGALKSGATKLKAGTQELCSKTAGMDDELNARVDKLIADISGSGEAPRSFVSEKNGTVAAVQFVIQTVAIEKPEATAEKTETQQDESFIDKLLGLFGGEK